MNKFFKKMSLAVIPLAFMLCAVVFDVPGNNVVSAEEEPHVHPICGEKCSNSEYDKKHNSITWTAISTAEEFTSNINTQNGHYYLTADIELTGQITINQDVCLCLNGHTITSNGSIFNIIQPYDRKITFTLCDCSSDNNDENAEMGGLYVNGSGNAVEIKSKITSITKEFCFNMYGGKISHSTDNDSGSGVYVYADGTFNMYGGMISGNTTDNNGGGVYAEKYAHFNMYGGTISGNKADNGGGVYMVFDASSSTDDQKSTFCMYGGTISGNTANNGGGVYAHYGSYGTLSEFNMYGGAIINNKAEENGGGIYTNKTAELSGEISGNTANNGGGVYVSSSPTITFNGCHISGNEAKDGGGVYYSAVRDLTMKGNSDISNNTAENGGGIYINSNSGGKFITEKGSTVSGNTATVKGDGVYIEKGTLSLAVNGLIFSNNKCDIYTKTNIASSVQINNSIDEKAPVMNVEVDEALLKGKSCKDSGVAFAEVSGRKNVEKNIFELVNNDYYIATKNIYSNTVFYVQKNHVADWTVTKSPTYTDEGTAQAKCSECGTNLEMTLPVLPDNYKDNDNWAVKNYSVNCGEYTEITHTYTYTDDETIIVIITEIKENNQHNHCLCGKTSCDDPSHSADQDIKWQIITNYDNIDGTKDGYYYLGENIELTGEISIEANITLCLNGHQIGKAAAGNCYFNISQGATLTICNCGKTGAGGLFDAKNSAVQVYGTFNMYGGIIGESNAPNGGGVYLGDGAIFNMYGGTISWNTASSNGGGVYLGEGAAFNMFGGAISNNMANGSGGGVYVGANNTFNMIGTANVTATKIEENTAQSNGGGVYLDNGATFNVNDNSSISNNTSKGSGGGVYVGTNTIFNVTGGDNSNAATSIINNKSTSTKSHGIYFDGGEMSFKGYVEVYGNGNSDIYFNTSDKDKVTFDKNFMEVSSGSKLIRLYTPSISSSTPCSKSVEVGKIIGYDSQPSLDTNLRFTYSSSGVEKVVSRKGIVCIEPAKHSGDLKSLSETTYCTEEGHIKCFQCTACERYYEDANGYYELSEEDVYIIEPTGHEFEEIPEKAATCTEDGSHACWYCKKCKKYFENNDDKYCTEELDKENVIIQQTGHNFVWEVEKVPTYQGKGSLVLRCSKCGELQTTDTLAALWDTYYWKESELISPTLSKSGHITYEYKRDSLGLTVTIDLPKLSDEGAWNYNFKNSPNMTSEVRRGYECILETFAGYVLNVYVPPLSNTEVWELIEEQSIKPTLNDQGNYVYISEDYGEAAIGVPKLTDKNVWTLEENKRKNPTLTEPGTYVYESKEYGEVEIVVPPLNDEDVWTLDEENSKEPTPTEPGKYVYTSEEYGEVVIVVPPTSEGGDNEGGGNEGGDNEGGDNEGGDNEGGGNEGGDNEGGDNEGGDNEGGDNEGGDNEGGDNEGGNTGNGSVGGNTDDVGIVDNTGNGSQGSNTDDSNIADNTNGNENPSTGVTVSLIPFAAAATALTVTSKRKKK